MPYSNLSEPNGFMFSYGSACGLLASTLIEGYKYVGDTYFFRQEGTAVDVDRYLGSIAPDNILAVLTISSGQIPFHHLQLNHVIIGSLPIDRQKQILSILVTQQSP